MRTTMLRFTAPLLAAACAVALAAPTLAETKVPGDPHADDPVGIVADPCPTANKAIEGQMVRVVFMGDSITDNWINLDPTMFQNGLVDRGISGQTTQQMLVRFRNDVIALKPQAVHIMAMTNDIAGNTGAATMETVLGNIQTMADLARAHGIKVIIASVPPAAAFPWSPGMTPAPQVAAINKWLADYARANGFTFVDYHKAMAQPDGAMKPGLSSDGVHPTREGYAIMRPLAEAAIAKTLGAK